MQDIFFSLASGADNFYRAKKLCVNVLYISSVAGIFSDLMQSFVNDTENPREGAVILNLNSKVG